MTREELDTLWNQAVYTRDVSDEPMLRGDEAHKAAVYRFAKLVAYYELRTHRATEDRLNKWMDEGERVFGSRGFGMMFRLGAWWADRPFRKNKDARGSET
jgi:hypothetical protein